MPSQKETSIPSIHFQVRAVSFREGNIWNWRIFWWILLNQTSDMDRHGGWIKFMVVQFSITLGSIRVVWSHDSTHGVGGKPKPNSWDAATKYHLVLEGLENRKMIFKALWESRFLYPRSRMIFTKTRCVHGSNLHDVLLCRLLSNLAVRLVSPEVGPRHCRSQGEIGSKPTRALGL